MRIMDRQILAAIILWAVVLLHAAGAGEVVFWVALIMAVAYSTLLYKRYDEDRRKYPGRKGGLRRFFG